MKRKPTIPIPEPIDWKLESEQVVLATPNKKTVNEFERIKYENTLAFGGLVPERSAFLDSLCRKLGNNSNPKSWAKGYTYEMPALQPGDKPGVDPSK
jgi:hypothetical protein